MSRALNPVMAFEDALWRGLGRAILYLQQHDCTALRDLILHACTHNYAYDAQSETNRALYMFDVIQATGEPEFYAERLCEHLTDMTENDNAGQILELSARIAGLGYPKLRELILQNFLGHVHQNLDFADAIIEMDGLAGYLFIIRHWIQYPLSEEDHGDEAFLLREVEKRFGAVSTNRVLQTAGMACPKIFAYIEHLHHIMADWDRQQLRRQTETSPTLTYKDVTLQLDDLMTPSKRFYWQKLGTQIDTVTLERFASDLLEEHEPARQKKLLWLFGKRRFPIDVTPIILWAHDTDREIADAALSVLSHIMHPFVRTFALELIKTQQQPWQAVDILAPNFIADDLVLLETLWAQEMSPVDAHRLGISLRELMAQNWSPVWQPLLLQLYEQGYCTLCRASVVQLLAKIGPLPDGIITEGRYDAYSGTRELVRDNTHAT